MVRIVKNKSIMGMTILLTVLVLLATLSTIGAQSENTDRVPIEMVNIETLATLSTIWTQTDNIYRVPVKMVDIEKKTLKIAGSVTNFDTVTFSHDQIKFNEVVKNNGTIMLTLLGNDFELELYETHFMGPDTAPDIQTYHGKVVGKESSRVAMTISDNFLIGMIDVDNNPYYIDLTKETINGKTVLTVYRDDAINVDNTFEDAVCGVETL